MDRILATHTGSLIRPDGLLACLAAKDRGESDEQAAYPECLKRAVSEVVERQVDVGIDVMDDGEMGKTSWITYLDERVRGLEAGRPARARQSMLPPGPVSSGGRRWPPEIGSTA
jgi:5-methyltetrahydropteroyltriglutamate--homocysteine methyltransferase